MCLEFILFHEGKCWLQADPPDVLKIPVADALGVTVVLLTCSYRQQEFVRVGYFINNEYTEPELRENPPAQPQFDKVSIRCEWQLKNCLQVHLPYKPGDVAYTLPDFSWNLYDKTFQPIGWYIQKFRDAKYQ